MSQYPARHKAFDRRKKETGISSGEYAHRVEMEQANRAYMERVILFVRPIAQEARCTVDWAMRCFANSVFPR